VIEKAKSMGIKLGYRFSSNSLSKGQPSCVLKKKFWRGEEGRKNEIFKTLRQEWRNEERTHKALKLSTSTL